ncbi:MAG: thioredoxin family protein [Leptospiraceae bacterium]|nr:thioredoxin family protein [Leptospiraceae bacterium]
MKYFSNKMNLRFIKFLILFLSFPIALFSQTSSAFEISSSTNLEMRSGGSSDLNLDVFIPKNQHLYIKKASALSFNNPTEFSIKTKGFDVIIKEEPSSEKKGEDYILPGNGSSKAGTYVLTIFETKGEKPSKRPKSVTLEIKTQWCNSSTDQCFSPKKITKKFKVKINGDKEVSMVKSRASGGVQWLSSFDQAKSNAKSSGQNIFVVITAPTWCGYCKVLERDVFSKSSVQNTLNTKFVSLQILDTNPDKRKFNFSGYPTMYMLDQNGKKISDVYGRDESSFLASIKKYEASGGGGSSETEGKTSFKYSIKIEGSFKKNLNGTWTQSVDGTTKTYKEYSRDENYVILQNEEATQFYALPQRGNKAYYLKNNKWEPFELE